jgi:YgiT-type zinc finger domain-containing protein
MLCADCRRQIEWREASQEFERDGLRVRISGIPATVCPHCGAISYPAGVPDKIIAAADSLFMADAVNPPASLLYSHAPFEELARKK